MKISEWLKYNIEKTEHDSFIISGARGSGKTTHMMAMAYEMISNNFKVKICYDVEDIPDDLCNYHCIFLDDFATKFYKRDSSSKKNREFAKLIQEIREVLPMIITTSPSKSLFDKDIRSMFKELNILSPGLLVIEGGVFFEVDLLQEGFPKFFRAQKLKERKRKAKRASEFIRSMR
ncbi:nSTAND3 domain-containing NTPase [Methanothermococcus okinawensis]|uniref:Novel STAND NTPase 3 domain-containing protein n=1 Tax=Methanothermococcus okinawensis (strain DSM 14208 / JCM 11175 / IH1) TaxID=647113 RepID=F8AKM0_METOI|nr:ATP-binding protein [Methanothermococcus okinawensis]AEH06353.1 hypothetical protein Metok_0364 [Methanothermococcus okinawensis IH1]